MFTEISNMDITAIVNAVINYGSIFLGILLALSTTVNLIVEVVKRLLPKVPTDIVVFVISIGLTILALFIAAAAMEITIMWYYAVGAVVMGIFVAYIAMFGWEKFTALWSRLTKHLKK